MQDDFTLSFLQKVFAFPFVFEGPINKREDEKRKNKKYTHTKIYTSASNYMYAEYKQSFSKANILRSEKWSVCVYVSTRDTDTHTRSDGKSEPMMWGDADSRKNAYTIYVLINNLK